ncbi:MAG TPA: sigma-70 family RNA polymerase sigma factor [Candidatus Limnocylindrales bacterium]
MSERLVGEADDAVLVLAVAAGSEDAFGALYDRHAGGVHAVALRMTGDRGTAEEVVQETFLALWNRAEAFDPGVASLGTWLRSIARNRAVDRLRAAGRRPQLVALPGGAGDDDAIASMERLDPDLAVFGGATRDPDPVLAAEAVDTREVIAEALAGMPDDERTVILLAYQQELSQSEIADRLGWPLGTVKTRTRRALARLRGLLEAAEVGTAAQRGQGGPDGPR